MSVRQDVASFSFVNGRLLKYQRSAMSEVPDGHPEQLDYLVRPNGCGDFEQRSRRRGIHRAG